MEPYVFDIILITLTAVILLHLVYNNSLLVKSSCSDNESECMANISLKDLERQNNNNNYNDSKYRDECTYGLDRTSNTNNWYHVANKLIANDATENNKKNIETIQNSVKINHQKKPKYVDLVGTPPNNLPNQTTDHVSKYMINKKSKDMGRLVFDDNYEGILSSDPFEANEVKIPSTFGPRTKHSDETYIDVHGTECSRSENDLDIKRYIRDYVLDGSAQCGCVVDKSKSEFTKDEVDEYREQSLRFHDKINGTSAPTEDPVDRMNMIALKGGIKAKGQTIADFYDNVVGGRISNLNGPGFIMGTSVPSGRCVKPPVFDNNAGVPQGYYTGDANAGGRYMKRDNWMYSNENPNNGGVFFDGITANDPFLDNDRMLDE
jgi:hypothetical protein